MIVKVLGYKISLEIIILMLVIYLVMMVHVLASCCNARAIAEGFTRDRADIGNAITRDELKKLLRPRGRKNLVENIIL
jgi:hypothetical protein